jgi:ribosomal protein S18 acetylase RimI-like enzyme
MLRAPRTSLALEIHRLDRGSWKSLKEVRLRALDESPDFFLSNYLVEEKFEDEKWVAEFDRGSWYVGTHHDIEVSLAGLTYYQLTQRYYIEYVWVALEYRRHGVALRTVQAILSELEESGQTEVFLWVLNGNDAALSLYEGLGFTKTEDRHDLLDRPGRYEEELRLDLGTARR